MSNDKKFILISSLISIIFIIFLWDTIFLKPLQIFAIAVHETFHGVAAFITGGEIHSMNLQHNSGTLTSSGGLVPIISAAGYIGTSMIGAGLVLATLYSFHKLLVALLTVLTFSVSIWHIDSFLSISLWVSLLVSLIILGLVYKTKFDKNISIFLGTFFAFASLEDIRNYFFAIPYQTDAGILARYYNMEFLTLPIAFCFAGLSLFIWYLAIKKVIKAQDY